MKPLLNIIGGVAVLLALLGVVLPLLPTTPFLLLASACFMRGSPRLQQRLLASRLGPYLHAYHEGRGIPLQAKLLALAMLWPSMLLTSSRLEQPLLQVLPLLLATGVSIYLLRLKTLRRETESPTNGDRATCQNLHQDRHADMRAVNDRTR